MGKTLRKHHPTSARSRTTRSHKPRLLADPTSSTATLELQLRALGLYPADTLGDGNCLFRALSDQLYGSPSRHAQLRAEVCDYVVGNRGRYEPFCEDERGLDVHVKCMRELGTYGGHLELSAFAHMVKRNVKVVQPGLVYVIEWSAGLSEEDAGKEERKRRKEEEREGLEMASGTVYVAYHDWEHFSSIRNLVGPHAGLPNVQEAPAVNEYDDDDEGGSGGCAYDAKDREKERKKERKDKERRKITRVKLKLSAPPSAASTPPPSQSPALTDTALSPSSSAAVLSLDSMSSLTSLAPSTSASPSVSSLPDSVLPTPPASTALGPALLPHPPALVATLSSTLLTDTLDANATLPLPAIIDSTNTNTNAPAPALPLSMRVHRSPKRSFDESASSEDGGSVVSEDVERGRGEKRSRVGSVLAVDSQGEGSQESLGVGGGGSRETGLGAETREETPALSEEGEDRDGDREGNRDESDERVGEGDREERGGDTEEEEKEVAASIIAPSSPHVTPQEIRDEGYSSLSELSDSDSGGSDDEDEGGDDGEGQPLSVGGEKGKLKKTGKGKGGFEKRVHLGDDGKPLTRKQRKAMGLPKFRGVPASSSPYSPYSSSYSAKSASGQQRRSAGKIVIPGGRFRKDGGGVGGNGGDGTRKGGREGVKEEWVKTGVGRVDVRGFRELKI